VIVRLATVDSTMTHAARLAAEGAAHGTWVVADEQTAGQGRHGRHWQSPRGGLYATGILRPNRVLPVMTLAIGLAAARAVAETSGRQPDLRWPNDLMFGAKKLGGILTVSESGAVLAGVGINLAETGRGDAASLPGVSRDALLEELIRQVEAHLELPADDILRLFAQSSSYVSGRRVQVEGHGEGVTAGLTPEGFLLLQQMDGKLVTVVAGGVRPA
jgi:BirA family biotin operon repressor/biotin-[acetyl-CoA-carboxylase] ligase